MTKTVLHIHQDYPDCTFPYPYTKAVSNLIDATREACPQYRHYVISINRTSNPFNIRWRTFDDGMAFVYWGIPFKFMHFITLWFASLMIRCVLRHIEYDLVHSHKLTTEGFIGSFMAKRKDCPHFISIRGGSDIHNIRRFSRYTSVYKRIFTEAKHIFWVSPWAANQIEKDVHVKTKPLFLFPNICEIDIHNQPDPLSLSNQNNRFISVINYEQFKRKGFLPLVQAVLQLNNEGIPLLLDVYGYGASATLEFLRAKVKEAGAENIVFLKGRLAQAELREEMSKSQGLLLPSENETFGMSYIEALSVGCPIMYMANTGVDGFFNQYNIGVKLQSQSVSEIKEGILNMLNHKHDFQNGLQQMHQDRYLKIFTADTVVQSYQSELKRFI